VARPAAARSADIELDLDHVEDLFEVDSRSMLEGRPRLYPGIEELMVRLDARPVRRPRVSVRIPAEELRDDTEERLRRAIDAYTRARLERTRRDIEAQRREGFRALVLGIVLFTIGFFVSYRLSKSGIDEEVRSFLADGVFLVFAWVSLWYPLDALIYYPMRQRRDRRLLRMLGDAEISVTGDSDAASRSR
jgi:hypothetical protein